MENGEWRMENVEWRMENGEWRMENGECRMEIEWMGLIYLMQHCSSVSFKAISLERKAILILSSTCPPYI
jgi:hypothetical protein